MKTDAYGRTILRDMNTGEEICVDAKAYFNWQCTLATTAIFEYCGREYRFSAGDAKMAGLLTDDQWLGRKPTNQQEETIEIELIPVTEDTGI